jgi:hypothetical protein
MWGLVLATTAATPLYRHKVCCDGEGDDEVRIVEHRLV